MRSKSLPRTSLFFLLSLSLFSSSCVADKRMTVGATATLLEEVAASSYRHADLKTVREGMPAYLMLMDGMIEAWPENERLLISAARAYSTYATVFVEEHDRPYAGALQGKALEYALKALERRGQQNPREGSLDDFEEGLRSLGKDDVPIIFWTATCWGSWISLNLDSMEALAELPRVELLMRRALELDEGFYYGGPHLFMGIYYASRPEMAGGDLQAAQDHFLRAIGLAEGRFLMAHVYYAQYYARRAHDKGLFVSTLRKVLDTPVDIEPALTLINAVARDRAAELLEDTADYFE